MSTILVVDDTAVCREPIAAILRRKGYQTLCAANGQEALDAVKHHKPDLIMLDIAMPVMDGLTFLKALREDPACSDTPVILLTAMSNKGCLANFQELGVSDTLLKAHFSLSEMIDCVKRYVPPTHAPSAA